MKRLGTALEHSAIRRRMLLAAPLGVATTLMPGLSFAHTDAAVAVLLPTSERIPGMKLDWQQGFEAELLAANARLQPRYLSYAVGSHRALTAAQSLLDEGCTTLTGIFSRNLATHLRGSLEKHGANFLVSDLGANAVRGDATCERITRVGPNLWHQAYRAGQHTAARGGTTALIATSFYEAGYDLPGAFKQGFVDGGGRSVTLVVTGTPELPTGDDGFARITAALAERVAPVDVLFSLYSGREASRYLTFARSLAPRVGSMVALSPLMHGMPRSKTADLPFTILSANFSGVSRANESLYTTMGRVAARSVLASRGEESCGTGSAWTTTLRQGSAPGTSEPVLLPASLLRADSSAPWQNAAISGWVAPYGA